MKTVNEALDWAECHSPKDSISGIAARLLAVEIRRLRDRVTEIAALIADPESSKEEE